MHLPEQNADWKRFSLQNLKPAIKKAITETNESNGDESPIRTTDEENRDEESSNGKRVNKERGNEIKNGNEESGRDRR